MTTAQASNIEVLATPNGPPMLLAHAIGCEQATSRLVRLPTT